MQFGVFDQNDRGPYPLSEQYEKRLALIEFYDRAGAKVKTLAYDGYTKLGGKFWRAQTWTMTNHQSQKSTVLAFSKLAVQSGLSPAEFSAGKLGDGR